MSETMNRPPSLSERYEAREELAQFVQDDLMGKPGEVIKGYPLDRILCGILHPQMDASLADGELNADIVNETPFTKASDHDFDMDPIIDDFDTEPVSEVTYSNTQKPSSIGITFAINDESDTQSILVSGSATRYVCDGDKADRQSEWRPVTVSTATGYSISVRDRTLYGHTVSDEVPGSNGSLRITYLIRKPVNGRIRVTVTLVNDNQATPKTRKDALCWFRPYIKVQTDQGYFVDGRPEFELNHRDSELQELDFLYRDQQFLAQGHSCSPHWDVKEIDSTDQTSDKVSVIETTLFPSYEVHLASPDAGVYGDVPQFDLLMGRIATERDGGQLHLLANAYEGWIDIRTEDLKAEFDSGKIDEREFEIGQNNLRDAERCLVRIRKGIESLSDDTIWRAFQLMSFAMIQQRTINERLALRDENGIPAVDLNNCRDFEQRWRPFQIAFILINLPALADPRHEDRELADLLFFPTGGGKTEAYLGCIGFSILYRRLIDPNDGGVSAIMRYTLRLLTTDQFDRAARLICALETIRRNQLPDSTVPISLGMWVGESSSPNTLATAEQELRKLVKGTASPDESILIRIRSCPACGETISYLDYKVTDHLQISCPRLSCDFNDGLPLYIVDEDLYALRPSMIVGTVDKFAQMAWRDDVRLLFSLDGKYCVPDLIIQDELHLISGPLGTMVGLYEAAIDTALSNISGTKPKVIASTATIRRANKQVRAVFDREAFQFPPAGITPGDNYFSKTASRGKLGTRRYIGVIAPGTSQASLLVRLYAAVLQAAEVSTASSKAIDPYWTLLGYFNSLRVLGSAYLQAVDDVPKRIEIIAKREGTDPRKNIDSNPPLELTSRVNAGEIITIRKKMEQQNSDAPNIVLATNMISVGLDIDRLGLMVVAGQPQNTSEYIQATSRVGRQHPGLVFVAFNAARTRDVSHFESFEPFHDTLYRSVEATTATPFAARARDRGAHGVLVSAVRLMFELLSSSNGAKEVQAFENEIREKVIKPIVRRAHRVSEFDSDALALETRLNALLDEWIEAAENGYLTGYGKMVNPKRGKPDSTGSLLVQAGQDEDSDRFGIGVPWETLTSLRDVDAETNVYQRVFPRTEDSNRHNKKEHNNG
ncbi:helicase-related protein [Corynebacterium endometrii]|uniref:Helicase C-terminal domain-containing protein n=1 Tax=Corynebacterium endometrii TaxID=2488819 RepID=A0A4P7QET8_9CORY|nr:helicase-related protein [Corynebacterium endometrii]QCB28201.1 hypothetical protein CENDO_04555 [Corynebacterium endometrii]